MKTKNKKKKKASDELILQFLHHFHLGCLVGSLLHSSRFGCHVVPLRDIPNDHCDNSFAWHDKRSMRTVLQTQAKEAVPYEFWHHLALQCWDEWCRCKSNLSGTFLPKMKRANLALWLVPIFPIFAFQVVECWFRTVVFVWGMRLSSTSVQDKI